jgi:tetratricopeptide (TPR) repeat protein
MTLVSEPLAKKYKARRRGAAVVVGALLLAVVAYGWWKWRAAESPSVEIPDVPRDGVDSEIVEMIDSARNAVEKNPKSASRWGRLGHVLRAHGFDDRSDECYARAEQIDGDDPRWPYLQAERRAKHDPAGALPKMKTALQLCRPGSKRQAVVALHMVRLLVQLNRLEEAAETLKLVAKSEPAAGHYHWHAGLVAAHGGRLKEAAEHFRKAMESPFTRKLACIRLSALYRRLGENAKSAALARRAETMPPNVPWVNPFREEYESLQVGMQARYQQAERLEKQGRYREAAELCQAEVERAPSARAFTSYGMLLARLGDYARSEQMLTAAVKENPRKIQAHYFLSAVSYFQGRRLRQREPQRAQAFFQRAVEHAKHTLEIKPDHGYAFLFLGRGLMELDRTKEAERAFRSAVRCRPEVADMHADLGRALLKLGRESEGRRELDLGVKMKTAHPQRNAPNQVGKE